MIPILTHIFQMGWFNHQTSESKFGTFLAGSPEKPNPSHEGWGSNHLERRSGSSRGVSFLGIRWNETKMVENRWSSGVKGNDDEW